MIFRVTADAISPISETEANACVGTNRCMLNAWSKRVSAGTAYRW